MADDASTLFVWHTLGEHILSAARHAATGRIGLRQAPGGIATPPFPVLASADAGRASGADAAQRRIRIVGTELVITDAAGTASGGGAAVGSGATSGGGAAAGGRAVSDSGATSGGRAASGGGGTSEGGAESGGESASEGRTASSGRAASSGGGASEGGAASGGGGASEGGAERRAPITTLAAAGAFVGITPGAPTDVFTPTTALDLERDLAAALDPAAADRLAAFYELAQAALTLVTEHHAAAGPAEIQLWPEHFDLATTIDEVNLGASPGDAAHPRPYFYVGPWTLRRGPFWNEPFGASCPLDQLTTPAAAAAFLEQGLDHAAADPPSD